MKILFFVLVLVAFKAGAGAYTFSGETYGENIITHPSTYTGAGGVVTVRVCINPQSPNAIAMENAVKNNIDVLNQMVPTTGNVLTNSNNNIPQNYIDFESVSLHEIGHCLGMAHINIASESGLSGDQQNYTAATDGVNDVFDLDAGADGVIGSSDDLRSDDANLLWFRRSNNDPFTIDSVVDSTTYSRNLTDLPMGHTFAANADRDVSILLGYPRTEAVMQQGSFFDEAQRTLGHDDVATLRYAGSGLDERETGGGGQDNNNNADDNYTIVLEYGGLSTTNCDISMGFTETTSLAFCGVSGQGLSANHVRLTGASIEFGNAYNWFFNDANIAPVLNAIGNVNLLDGEVRVVNISATDPDNDTLSFNVSGLPAFASIIDNADGTAVLTISPALGENSQIAVTITVIDDGVPNLSDSEVFTIDVAVDSDRDGLSDADEVNIYGTLIDNPDSDGDFIDDGVEVANGSEPTDPLSWPAFADGDIAPLGAPDGVINAADYLLAQQIVLGGIVATSLELAHADLYPVGSPDGVIDTSDLILLLKIIQ